MTATLSACPACAAAPLAEAHAAQATGAATPDELTLSLPGIHCAACIAGVENALRAVPGVVEARVNLTRKQAFVKADAGVSAATLITVLGQAGHHAEELDSLSMAKGPDKAGRDLVMRLAVAGFAMMNVMLLSVAVWSGAEGPTRDLFHWISAAIAIPAIAFSAVPFFSNAMQALRVGRLNMDVPIALAISLAVVTSLWETALGGEHAYFDAAIALTFFLLAGRWLDHRTRRIARSAAEELSALEVPRAWRVTGAGTEEVRVGDLMPGDVIHIHKGARVPVDCRVITGQSDMDRSLITGETRPDSVHQGSALAAGEINLSAPLRVEVLSAAKDSTLARMADLVAVAESGRTMYLPLADRAAKLYAPGVHILSALSFLGWMLWSGDLRVSLNIAAAVLIITCPCALGLAVPAVTTAATGRLFRKGMLVKSGTALERMAEVDTVVLDKTGTLTNGMLAVDTLATLTPTQQQIALALADQSDHPLAQALARHLWSENVTPAGIDRVEVIPGAGIQGQVNGQTVRLGQAQWLGAEPGAGAETWLSVGDAEPRRIGFVDQLRTGAAEAVSGLRAAGLRVVIASGDAEPAVAAVAQKVGADVWHAGVLPDQKLALISELGTDTGRVMMVGDGLNDAAALSAAHVSISPASALDAARVASDVVLLGDDLSVLPGAVFLSRQARKRIAQNFQIATAYNVIAVPLAVAGLATPLIAALAMSLSSITVSLNALRLGKS